MSAALDVAGSGSHAAIAGPCPSAPGGSADKAFATLQARAALAGVQLVRSTDDRGREVFIASRWALTARFASLAEVETWLQEVGGRQK